jgi:hypothetical protein
LKPEVFPQYWNAEPDGSAAYNRRESATRTVCVHRDGSERAWFYKWEERYWDHLQITKEEAEALVTPLEVFPQYWTTLDRESKRPDSVAFLIRKNKFDWNIVQKDGVHWIKQGKTSKWDSYLREQLTKEQAEALLLPKESPDDWVVQDRVPARAGIDRGHFGNSFKSPEDMWGFVSESMGIGEMHGSNDLVVYCRRKDLPEPKAETRTVVIIRWLCWNEDGKERIVQAANRPTGFLNCLNVGEEKFEVKS